MANILRMDLYRLMRSKSLWIILGIIVAIAVINAATAAFLADPSSIDTLQAASGGQMDENDYAEAAKATAMLSEDVSPEALAGSLFLGGGGLVSLFVIFIAIFLAAEFENGFSKNVFTAQPNRLAFLGARTVETFLLAAAFTAIAIGATLAAALAVGIKLTPVPLPDLLLWGALIAGAAAGFGMLTALAVWLTRKMAAGIVVGVVLSTGLVASALQMVLLFAPGASFLGDFTLSSCMSSLALGLAGPLGAPHIALVSVAFIAVAAVASAVVLQRKDI